MMSASSSERAGEVAWSLERVERREWPGGRRQDRGDRKDRAERRQECRQQRVDRGRGIRDGKRERY
jgi:hypothetical protein